MSRLHNPPRGGAAQAKVWGLLYSTLSRGWWYGLWLLGRCGENETMEKLRLETKSWGVPV